MLKFIIEEIEEEYGDEPYLEQGTAYSSVDAAEREPVYCPRCSRLLGEVADDDEVRAQVGFYCWKCKKGMLTYVGRPQKRKIGFV